MEWPCNKLDTKFFQRKYKRNGTGGRQGKDITGKGLRDWLR